MSRSLTVFALRNDLLLALELVERHTPLTYRHVFCDTEVWETKAIPTWHSAAAVEDMGAVAVAKGETVGREFFLILPQAVPFRLRQVKQFADGSWRYFVDQVLNPASVTFKAGGPLGDDAIVPGEFSTGTTKRPGFDLLGAIRRAVRREFAPVRYAYVSPGAYAYVGPAASAAAQAGVRLAQNRNAPRSMDLVLPKPRRARRAEQIASADGGRDAGSSEFTGSQRGRRC
jgi:hypothetical protein